MDNLFITQHDRDANNDCLFSEVGHKNFQDNNKAKHLVMFRLLLPVKLLRETLLELSREKLKC